jgi:hypothetical protein
MTNAENKEIKNLEFPLNYPYCYNDEQLKEKIKEISNAIIFVKKVDLVHKYSAFAQIGLNELNNRQFEKEQDFFKTQAEQSNKNTKKSFNLSLLGLTFSIMAIILSGISVYFSNKDDKADTQWQKMQKELFEQEIKEQQKNNKLLEELLLKNQNVKNSETNKQ